jgi:CheY-like chemotaxis protein
VKVMVVEDEAMIAMIIEDYLADLGCEVVGPFAAVTPALTYLSTAAADVDAALLDVNLGGERVFPVAEALRARGTPFVFATGYGVVEDERYGDIPVLPKPLEPEHLAEAVARFRRSHELKTKTPG